MQFIEKMENTGRNRNFDRRMTGASVIDEALQEVSKCILDAANISLTYFGI